jgi:hypothetical protein
MDMHALEFPDHSFDVAIRACSLFFAKDMITHLVHMAAKVKYEGQILITTLFENAFSPLIDLFLVHKFKIQTNQYLQAYRFAGEDLELIMIGPHENYYRDLKSYLKSR